MPVLHVLINCRLKTRKDKVRTDSVVLAYFQCNPQLCTDTIGAGDKQTILAPARSLEIKDSAKPTDCPIRSRASGLLDKGFDGFDKVVACIHGDTSLSVRERLVAFASRGGFEGAIGSVSIRYETTCTQNIPMCDISAISHSLKVDLVNALVSCIQGLLYSLTVRAYS